MKRSFACGWGIVLTIGCQQAPNPAPRQDASPPDEPKAAESPRARVADVTPEISAKAAEILRAHPEAPFGTEFPFELGAHKFVAKFEVHDNPDGDPDRPRGPHKGITVYVVE